MKRDKRKSAFKLLWQFFVLEHNRRLNVDAIAIDKRKLIDALTLATQPIQTFCILI
jgi:hypothetical protein